MDHHVLVAYATKNDATEDIALHIGRILRKSGLNTAILPADRVRDISRYTAVVLGSAVYIGQWLREAARFLKTQEETLAERPVWLFSSGPTGTDDPIELTRGWRFPKGLQPIADRIRPRDIMVFHGAIDTEYLNFIQKRMIKRVKAPVGDFRDWNAIAAWTETIAEALNTSAIT